MAQLSRSVQDPSYTARQDANLGAVAAGSGGQTSKFVAFANLLLFSVTGVLTTAGTSTYTQGGTATGGGPQQISVITIVNTSSTTAPALSTSTFGPFLIGGTATAAVGGANQYALNTNTSTAGYGGIPLPQGAQMYCVSGTDATAVSVLTVDYQIAPGAGLTQ